MDKIDVLNSIIKETEAGYISYGNLHNNQDEGLKLIHDILKREIPRKPIKRYLVVNGFLGPFLACPNCKEQLERSHYYVGRCSCGQKIIQHIK